MKLPLLAAAAFLVSISAASAQWGPPRGYPPPPPPGYGYGGPPPPPYYRGYRHGPPRMVRRCWVRDTPWGPRRTCRMVPARRW